MNKDSLSRVRVLSALVAATLVVACGGGGSDAAPTPPPPPPPPPPASVIISGKAVDGALQGATACYDLNDNRLCDAGEPSSVAVSDASGNFTISVLQTDSGKHRVIVNVPATAIDADTGAAVGKAFTLVAPATGTTGAQSVFVSPLTTLVLQQADSAGQTLAQATAFVQAQLGLAVSPLADFTAAASAANTQAANAGKLLLLTQQQQTTAVAAAVGQTDLSGGTVSQADVDKAVAKAVAGALPMIGAAVADPVLAAKTGGALQSALGAAATAVVAQVALTPSAVVTAAGIAKLPADPAPTTAPEASAALAALQYTDANHWFLRVNQGSALDNTPDANGLQRYVDVRTRMQPYNYQPTLGVAEAVVQAEGTSHWNGSGWVACTLGQRNTQTVRDAQGRASYNSCDNYFKGITTRGTVDIAGQSLASVVTDKILPVVGGKTDSNGWILDVGLLGAATFPAGSKLFLQTDLALESAPAYSPGVNSIALFSDAVAQGGDARLGTQACQNPGTAVNMTSLEQMASRAPGKPCIFNAITDANGTGLSPDESWGTSTISLGDLPNAVTLPAGTGNYYTTTARMRVSFAGTGNGTVYYQCYQRRSNNSPRNCTTIGTGTYTIATLGDARVMTLNNLPAAVQRLANARIFVERGGLVYAGTKSPVGVETPAVRMNLPAANAMMVQLGLPPIKPADAPNTLSGAKATTAATLKGVWGGSDGTTATIIRFGDNGEFLMGAAGPTQGASRSGLEKGWLDFDPATGQTGALLEIDSNGDVGISHLGAGENITSITDTAINGTGFSIPRFVDDPNGIVGMWAGESATDLKAAHFVFFANGKLLSIHPEAETQGVCATNRVGPPGIEWSDYTFNAGTGALRVFNKIYDTTGCTGLFDSAAAVPNTEVNLVLTFAADRKSFTVIEAGQPAGTGYRIAPR